MDLGTLAQKIFDIRTAVKNGDYFKAVGLVLEIIKAISDILPKTALGKPRVMAAANTDTKTLDELCDEAEAACKPHASSTQPTVDGPLVTLLLPLALAILKKLLGL